MLSPFGILLTALEDYIAGAVPEIKWVDQDFGQLEYYKEGMRPAVVFPCVLIDFTGWVFEDAGPKVQTGTGGVDIRIAHAPFTNSSQVTPADQRALALNCYELEKKLYQALHWWRVDPFQKLLRSHTDTEKREDTIRVRVMRFTTGFKDTSAAELTIVAVPIPVVGRDIVLE